MRLPAQLNVSNVDIEDVDAEFIGEIVRKAIIEEQVEDELQRDYYRQYRVGAESFKLETALPSWHVAKSEVVDITELCEFIPAERRRDFDSKYLVASEERTTLPVEFYAHQLIDFDFTDDEQVLGFSVKYGILCFNSYDEFIHTRFGEPLLMQGREVNTQIVEQLPSLLKRKRGRAEAATDFNPALIHDRAKFDAFISAATENTALNNIGVFDTLYPFENVRTSLIIAQQRFRALLGMVASEAPDEAKRKIETRLGIKASELPFEGYEALDFLNYGGKRLEVKVLIKRGRTYEEASAHKGGSLYRANKGKNFAAAICNQFIDVLAMYDDWNYCNYCGRPFKRKQHDGNTKTKTDKKPPRPTMYCCEKCRNTAGNERKKEHREQLNRTNRRAK